MSLFFTDNVLDNPIEYVEEALNGRFVDIPDGDRVFRGIQIRGNDEFANFVLDLFPDCYIVYNFIRKSPLYQEEPNFIHKDDMMGDLTAILYLNEIHPKEDGTTIYNDDETESCVVYSKFNRMLAFDSELLHSRNIYDNFGEGENARLVQVIFLKYYKDGKFN
jgi:hypothetical protein